MTADRPPDSGPPDTLCPALNPDDPARYRICAQGRFSPSWLDMLSGEWTIAGHPADRPGATTLVGRVLDQAALIGVLEQLAVHRTPRALHLSCRSTELPAGKLGRRQPESIGFLLERSRSLIQPYVPHTQGEI